MVSAVFLSFVVTALVHLASAAQPSKQKQKHRGNNAMEFVATRGLSSESPAHNLKEVVHKSAVGNAEGSAAAGHRVSLAIDPHGEVKKVADAQTPSVETLEHQTLKTNVHEETKKSVGIQEKLPKAARNSEHQTHQAPAAQAESTVREAVREVPDTVIDRPKTGDAPPSGVRHAGDAPSTATGNTAGGEKEMPASITRILEGLSGGTGTALEPTGDQALDQEIRFRMQAQDTAVLLLLMMIYIIILIFMYSMVYRMSRSDSTVRYYCNPAYHRMTLDNNDFDRFLGIFNQRPLENKPQIRVAGFNLAPGEGSSNVWQAGMQNAVSGAQTAWRGKTYDTTFYYALDLEQWTSATGEMDEKDQITTKEFLNCSNPLATLVISKEAVWDDFEEVATNIKAKIRESGFEGPIDVTISPPDRVIVYQNDHWANFMYNETVKVMTLLSIVGGLVYVPYMWIRGSRAKHTVTSKFKVSIDKETYWKLIEKHISVRGFAVPEDASPGAWPPGTPPQQIRADRDRVNPNADLAAQLMNTTSQ